jgi:hypothetical protein
MADVTHRKIERIDAIDGFFEGIKFHRAAAGLGVSSFGISIIDLAPGADEFVGATPGEPYDAGGRL